MAAPVIESVATAVRGTGEGAGTDLSFSQPTGLASGDLILFMVLSRTSNVQDWLTFSGYTQSSNADNASDIQGSIYYKVADSDDANSGNWPKAPTTTASTFKAGWCFRISGISGTPVNIIGTWSIGATSPTFTISGVTTDADDCLVLGMIGTDGADITPTSGSGTGWSASPDYSLEATTDNANVAAGDIYTKTLGSQGATSDITATASGNDGAVSVQIAIAPAAAAGGGVLGGIAGPGGIAGEGGIAGKHGGIAG